MTRQHPVRVVAPRTGPDGRLRFAADLGVATTLARWAAGGSAVQLRTGVAQGTVADWAGALRRGAADVLVVPAGPGDAEARWCAERLGADLVTATGLDDRLAGLLPDQVPPREPGMPYQRGILAVQAAAEAGLDAASPAALGELGHLGDPRRPVPLVVPLLRCPVGNEQSGAADRSALVGAAARSGVELLPVLAPEQLTLSVARTLRSAGITRVRLDALPGAARAVRAAQVVAGAAVLGVTVQVDLAGWAGPEVVTARQVSALVQARPDTTVVASATRLRALAAHGALRGVLPTSALARTVREESRRGRAARERLVDGHYPAVPLVGGPHDLWWDHVDQPHEHREWLSTLIPMGGHLHLSADHDASRWAASVPVSDHREITAYSVLAPGADGALAVLATPDCVATFVADAEAAWCTGTAPGRFLAAAVAGLCAVGAPCWTAGGRRLYVDRAGVLRCRPGGPALGTVGDPFSQVRRRLRAGTCGVACEIPPWLPRVLAARAALRALVPTDSGAPVSGLGAPLLHSYPRSTAWPTGLALVRVGDRHLVHHAGHGTTAELGRGQAAALELCLDLGADAAPVLSDLRGSPVTAQDVTHLVSTLLARLTGTQGGDPGAAAQPTQPAQQAQPTQAQPTQAQPAQQAQPTQPPVRSATRRPELATAHQG